MYIIWWPTFAMFISREWEDKSTLLLSHISAILAHTRDYISWNIKNLMFKNPTSRSVSTKSMKLLNLLLAWKLCFLRNKLNSRMLQKKLKKCWKIWRLSKELLKKLKLKLTLLHRNVRDKLKILLVRKKKLKDNWQQLFLPRWEPRQLSILWMLQVWMKWRLTKNLNKFWNLCWMLLPFTLTWN